MIAAVLNHLWQSTLFTLLIALMMPFLRKEGAHVRYWLWQLASFKFLAPFWVLVSLGGYSAAHGVGALPVNFGAPPAVVNFVTQPVPTRIDLAANIAQSRMTLSIVSVATVVWASGVAVVLLLWLRVWSRLAAVRRKATVLPIQAPIPVMSSETEIEPGIVGIFRPVILLPEGIAKQLTPSELKAILAHEFCHLRRRDNLTAVIHMLIQALFWFHPLVWWLGSRLVDERERACDETVLRTATDPQTYAECILKVCRFYVQSPLLCAAGVSGANLKLRIEGIMTNRTPRHLGWSKKLLMASVAVVAIAIPLMTGWAGSSQAQASSDPAAVIAARRAEQAQVRHEVPIDSKLLPNYAGAYQLGPAIFKIWPQSGHLMGQLPGQPPVDFYPESDKKFFSKLVPAQISFDTDAQGRPTELVLHQNGYEQQAKRVDDADAKRAEDALAQRIKENKPAPGTEAALRHQIEAMMAGQPDYSQMTPMLAEATRAQYPTIKNFLDQFGPIKSIAFATVGAAGQDVYTVNYEHGTATWLIVPLTSDGKIGGLGGVNFKAQ